MNKTKTKKQKAYPFQGPLWVLGAGITWTGRMQGRNSATEAAGLSSDSWGYKVKPSSFYGARKHGPALTWPGCLRALCFCQNSPLGTCEQHRTSFLTSRTSPAGGNGHEFWLQLLFKPFYPGSWKSKFLSLSHPLHHSKTSWERWSRRKKSLSVYLNTIVGLPWWSSG